MAHDRDDLLDRIGNAFLSFLLRDFSEPEASVLWSEGDCAFRFAEALEEVFPRLVHVGMPVSAATVSGFDAEVDRRQTVDVVVADLDGAPLRHDVFVDVAYLPRGSRGARTLGAVAADGERLLSHLERGHCAAAVLLVVDEGNVLDDAYATVNHAPGVPVLLASPKAIGRRAYAVQHEVELPLWCPSCESPRLAAMRYGAGDATGADEWIDGGAPIWGDGRDAQFGCRDCGFRGPRRRVHHDARSRPAAAPAPHPAV
jgi:hypothetical protein